MPILTTWFNADKTIIKLDYISPYTFDELFESYQAINQLLDEGDHAVHFLIDLSQSRSILRGGFSQFRKIGLLSPGLTHPRAQNAMSVYIGASRVVERFIGVFMQVVPTMSSRLVPADTQQEALEMIASFPTEIQG